MNTGRKSQETLKLVCFSLRFLLHWEQDDLSREQVNPDPVALFIILNSSINSKLCPSSLARSPNQFLDNSKDICHVTLIHFGFTDHPSVPETALTATHLHKKK